MNLFNLEPCTYMLKSFNIHDFQRMRQGVERDIERQRRKEENRRLLEEQIELERKLKERDEDRDTHNGR